MIAGLTILPFRANWKDGVQLRSSFATNIFQSTAGSQTRFSQRDYGRRQIRFRLLPYHDFRRQWDAFREVNPPGTLLGVPLWSEQGIVLTAAAASGATTLTVNNAADIDWRGLGVLISATPTTASGTLALQVEGFNIQSISGNTITLAAGLTNAFNAGDEVLPLMLGHQLADYADDFITPEISDVELTFDENLNDLGSVSFATPPTYPTYLGLPVLPLIAEWSTTPKGKITQNAHYLVQGLNAESIGIVQAYVRQGIAQRVGMACRADRALLWQFFHDREGRWDRFWLPALKDELKLAANVSASDTTLELENYALFAERYGLGADLRMAIFLTDGFNWWTRQVINLSGGTNRVTIDAALGTALNMNACQIGMLTFVQFAADDLVVDLQAPVVGTATLAFTELEKEYAEVIAAGSGDASGTRVGQELVAG
jgi:hypothetical protein